MKRSQINRVYHAACDCFARNGWTLPPNPRWDITDFGLGRFDEVGLTLVNLTEQPEYCEKLMYAKRGQVTPLHAHRIKKEDIICRCGRLVVELWADRPDVVNAGTPGVALRNGEEFEFASGDSLTLEAGERVTMIPGVYHTFWPETEECIIGEVSTANDDRNDNFFVDPEIGRYSTIDEDEAPAVTLLSE